MSRGSGTASGFTKVLLSLSQALALGCVKGLPFLFLNLSILARCLVRGSTVLGAV